MDAILPGVHIDFFFPVYLYSNVINIFTFQLTVLQEDWSARSLFFCIEGAGLELDFSFT
jgi:hypothetical protein